MIVDWCALVEFDRFLSNKELIKKLSNQIIPWPTSLHKNRRKRLRHKSTQILPLNTTRTISDLQLCYQHFQSLSNRLLKLPSIPLSSNKIKCNSHCHSVQLVLIKIGIAIRQHKLQLKIPVPRKYVHTNPFQNCFPYTSRIVTLKKEMGDRLIFHFAPNTQWFAHNSDLKNCEP